MPIQEAIEHIESREPGEQFSYREVAKKFNVDRTTLSRRHQGKQTTNAGRAEEQALLNPQQELELARYIERCTSRGLPPTREMIQNFASAVAKWEVSYRWVSRFLHRHDDKLTSKWSAGIDRDRHKADNGAKYKQYFDLLHTKMEEYNIDERNTYNMDEKGFFVGRETRSKRVFSKASLSQKERTAALQDGNREWVTLLACVCASGEALPPALIYQGTSGIQSSWVDDLVAEQHEIFVSNSASGWSNNDLGLAWLQQVFNRYTKAKARIGWRLLILDGHGSHLTREFLDSCDANRILLMVFPPHSTHSLQPLDVVLFSPLSRNYTTQLNRNSQRSLGITRVTKADFYRNFWAAWSSTMKRDTIIKSFQATGVWPKDADVVLKRFRNGPQRRNNSPEIQEQGDGDSWTQLRKVFDAAVADKTKVEAKRLSQGMHSLQVNNELLHAQNKGLQRELDVKSKRTTQRITLNTQDGDEGHGGAVWWSPKKLREHRERKAAEQDEAEQLQLQKTHDRELKAAATASRKQQQEEAKVARRQAAKERREAKKARAEELAAQRALKKQQRDAATAQKSHDTLRGTKRQASRKVAKTPTKRRCVVAATSRVDAGLRAASPPPKKTRSGRNVVTPAKFK